LAEQGAIYDLGYRHYDGERREYAATLWALFIESLRIAFGLGRKFAYKAGPAVLLAFAVVPAAVALGIAAALPADVELYRYDDYYDVVAIVIALYCAIVAPDLVGRDIRNRTLPLYISRGITRLDYIGVKLAAMVTATLLFSLIPQALLFAGNTVAADNPAEYFVDDMDSIPQIVGSALAIGVLLGSLATVISAHTTNRAYATGMFVALVILSTSVVNLLYSAGGQEGGWTYVLLGGVLDVLYGSVDFIFGNPAENSEDIWDGWYLVALIAWSGGAILLTIRRYLGLRL
jgi:ABC-2 type transport system permease protein